MAKVVVNLLFVSLLSFEIQAVTITEQAENNLILKQGQAVTISFNYSLSPSDKLALFTIGLDLNGTTVFSHTELNGNILRNVTLGHFQTRSDIQILRSQHSYIGIVIRDTQWSDTGEYIWGISLDGSMRNNANPINVIIGSEPKKVVLSYIKKEGLTYELECQVTGAIPLPNITIYNGTEVLHEASSTVSTSDTINATSLSEYSCNATNALGTVGSNRKTLPVKATESPTTTPLTSPTFGGDTASTATSTIDKTKAGHETGRTTTPVMSNNDPKTGEAPIGLIVGVAVGAVFLIVVIGSIVYVCVCKVKVHKTDPDKERVAATTENQYSETPMNDTKCQQEQEEKQQRNVEGLQYADLDLRPTGKTKPAGGCNNLVIDEDSKTEYAEVRKT